VAKLPAPRVIYCVFVDPLLWATPNTRRHVKLSLQLYVAHAGKIPSSDQITVLA